VLYIDPMRYILGQRIFQIEDGDWDFPDFKILPRYVLYHIPEYIIAGIIDVLDCQGAVDIKSSADQKHIDKVGPVAGDDNVIIVPWQRKWCFEPIGLPRVAYVQRKLFY